MFSSAWLFILKHCGTKAFVFTITTFITDGRQQLYRLLQMTFYRLSLHIMVCLEHYDIKIVRSNFKTWLVNNEARCSRIRMSAETVMHS